MEENGSLTRIAAPFLSAEEVYCDLCNAWIPFRPVPSFLGTHALCKECFGKVIGLTLEEAARMDGVTIRWMSEEGVSDVAGA